MISVDILSDNKFWNKKLKKAPLFFNILLSYFPKRYQFKNKKINFSVLLSNNKNIKKLNKKFRNKNTPTDVLSFPLEKKLSLKKNIYLGDIIISYEFMNKPKSLSSLEFKKKTTKIFIHGFLHLLGYDHIKFKDFKSMNKEEIKIYNIINKKIEKIV